MSIAAPLIVGLVLMAEAALATSVWGLVIGFSGAVIQIGIAAHTTVERKFG